MNAQQLELKFFEAISARDYNLITDLFAFMNNSSDEFKIETENLYKQIGDIVFEELNFISPNYSLETYRKKQNRVSKKTEQKELLSKEPLQVPSFETELINFYNRNKKSILSLKDYYIFHLENSQSISKFQFQILCCDISINSPFLCKLHDAEHILPTSKERIINFVDRYKSGQYPEGGFICLLSLTPTLNDFDDIKSYLKKLGELFEIAQRIIIKESDSDLTANDFKVQSMERAIADIKQCCTKVFNNADISFGEERLIKKFFSNSETIINYKVIKPGQSGSRVIEVQSVSHLYSAQKRFVIKIAKMLDDIGKLQNEHERFNDHVKNASTTQTRYSAHYDFNDSYEAIQYDYASTGSLKDAISFSKLIDEFLDVNKKINYPIDEIIEKLLESELFTFWNPVADVQKTCFELYQPYLKNEEKIFDAINIINDSNIDTPFILDFYKKIKSFKLKTKRKVCHGDLHTDNFFWDERNVTLIDFGFTDRHHSVVDHTFLEMSIKMKHFPKYIPLNEILECEKKFLSSDSFNESFDLSFIQRENLKSLYNLVHKIRVNSKKYVKNRDNQIEYFISLFLINFRQIQFWDLNQLLGLKCAELYSKELSKILGFEKS